MRFIATMLISGSLLLAQAQSLAPTFEVASVKVSPACTPSVWARSMRVDKARFIANCQSLKTLIFWAYKVKQDQVSGPEWLDKIHVDIEAKLPEGAREDQAQLMVQSLLADRFKMTVHRENREQAVYALVVAKSGLKIKAQESIAEPETPPPPDSITVGLPGSEIRISQTAISGGGVKGTKDQNGMHFVMSQIAALVGFLPEFVDRPVVDKTNLKGSYAIRLDFPIDQIGHGRGAASEPGGGAALMLNAVERLGLKLESEKAPVEMIVVDHIERAPSEN